MVHAGVPRGRLAALALCFPVGAAPAASAETGVSLSIGGSTRSCPSAAGRTAAELHAAAERLRGAGRAAAALECAAEAAALEPSTAPYVCLHAELQRGRADAAQVWRSYARCCELLASDADALRGHVRSGGSPGRFSRQQAVEWLLGTLEQQGLRHYQSGDLIRKGDPPPPRRLAGEPRSCGGGKCRALPAADWRAWRSAQEYRRGAEFFRDALQLAQDEGLGEDAEERASYGAAVAHHNAGTALQDAAPAEAEQSYRSAWALNKRQGETATNLGSLLAARGDRAGAERWLRRGVGALPGSAEANSQLAAFLSEAGRCAEALPYYEAALRIRPVLKTVNGHADCARSASGTMAALEAYDSGAAALREAGAAEADIADVMYNAGTAAVEAGQASVTRAVAYFDAALALYGCGEGTRPAGAAAEQCAYAHNNRGIALERAGEAEGAGAAYGAAVRLLPRFPRALTNLAGAARQRGDTAEAEQLLLKALAADPEFAEASNNLGGLFSDTGRVLEALPHYAAASARLRTNDAFLNLAYAMRRAQRWGARTRASEALRQRLRAAAAGAAHSDRWGELAAGAEGGGVQGLRLLHLLSDDAADPALMREVTVARAAWMAAEAAATIAVVGAQLYARLRQRRRRAQPAAGPPVVGLVTADLRDHPVGVAMAGLLAPTDAPQRPLPARFWCLYADTQGRGEDAVTDVLRLGCDGGYARAAGGNPDRAVLESVAAAEPPPDLLVDISGNTQGGAELFFAGPAAAGPFAAWLGFPASSGAAGTYFADPVALPPAVARRDFSERVAYLCPSLMVSAHAEAFPHSQAEVEDAVAATRQALPQLPGRGKVLCVTAQPHKISPRLLAVWAAALRSAPGAAIAVLEFSDSPGTVGALRRAAAGHGIAPERIFRLEPQPRELHAAVKGALCAAVLDSAGYNGHVSTLDALAAGLPVIAVEGAQLRSRVSASLLRAAGLRLLAPRSLRSYQRIAELLLREPRAGAAARRRLRQGADAAQGLFDAAAFRRSFATAAAAAARLPRLGLRGRQVAASCPGRTVS